MKHAAHVAHDRVLAVYPNVPGFGWTLFEGPLSPVEWGVVEIKKNRAELNSECLDRFRVIIDKFDPCVLLLEQFVGAPSRRSHRIQSLCRSLIQFVDTRGIDVRVYTRADIESAFAPAGAKTRRQIAIAIAKHIEAFGHLLPPARKIWLAESPRMGLFNAAALAITYYWQTDVAEWP